MSQAKIDSSPKKQESEQSHQDRKTQNNNKKGGKHHQKHNQKKNAFKIEQIQSNQPINQQQDQDFQKLKKLKKLQQQEKKQKKQKKQKEQDFQKPKKVKNQEKKLKGKNKNQAENMITCESQQKNQQSITGAGKFSDSQQDSQNQSDMRNKQQQQIQIQQIQPKQDKKQQAPLYHLIQKIYFDSSQHPLESSSIPPLLRSDLIQQQFLKRLQIEKQNQSSSQSCESFQCFIVDLNRQFSIQVVNGYQLELKKLNKNNGNQKFEIERYGDSCCIKWGNFVLQGEDDPQTGIPKLQLRSSLANKFKWKLKNVQIQTSFLSNIQYNRSGQHAIYYRNDYFLGFINRGQQTIVEICAELKNNDVTDVNSRRKPLCLWRFLDA